MLMKLINRLLFFRDPVRFCRDLGVEIGQDCQILGTRHPFGSEPYLIRIGNHVRINADVQFITHDGGVWVLRQMKELSPGEDLGDIDRFGSISVGDNVQIGSRAVILPGVTIGSNVVIGAGAIVTKSIPDNSVAAGVPAKVIESIEEYYEKNKARFEHTKGLSPEEKKAYLLKKAGKERSADL